MPGEQGIAVTRQGKGAIENGIEKARIGGANAGDHIAPDVLSVDMPDTVAVAPNEGGGVGAGIGRVPGVD